MIKKSLLFIITLLVSLASWQILYANDGIPDNCENANGEFYRPNLFPRYEPQNRRLVLVDWATGEDSLILGTDLPDTVILSWSADCRYLAGAVGSLQQIDNVDTLVWETVVWDTVDNFRVGSVPDAHTKPHHITWGAHSFLVVETRNGAILWNVPANTQTIITTLFDPITGRNFSRLRWDAANRQLIVNFAVGGRTVYNLDSGEEAPVALGQVENQKTPASVQNNVIIGGGEYACRGSYITDEYNPNTQSIYLVLHDWGTKREPEVLQVVETDLDIQWYRPRGWSVSCRYFAAALGVSETVSDTVVWDTVENRRVGVIPDARNIVHPITWSPSQDALLVETRNGGYLWYLPTNTRTLIEDNIQVEQYNVRNFSRYKIWDSNRNQLLVSPINELNTFNIFDIPTGALISTYTSSTDEYILYDIFADSAFIIIYEGWDAILWNRDTGNQLTVTLPQSRYQPGVGSVSLSLDHRLLVTRQWVGEKVLLYVWDLQVSTQEPAYIHEIGRWNFNTNFIDNVTLGSTSYPQFRFNVITGEGAYVDHLAESTAALEGQSGESKAAGYWNSRNEDFCDYYIDYAIKYRQLILIEGETRRVIDENLNRIDWISRSPDCHYVMAVVESLGEPESYDTTPIDDLRSYRNADRVMVWDVESGNRIAEFNNPGRRYAQVAAYWSPGSDRIVIRTTQGFFLLSLQTGESVLLTFAYPRSFMTLYNFYWDYENGRVLADLGTSRVAFDMITGAEVESGE